MASSEASINKGSGEDFGISCEICIEDGNTVEVSGFCQSCEEYLCMACMKIHCKPKPMRHHVILNQQEMPEPSSRKKFIACTEPCKEHPAECLKFYCKEHDAPLCGDCMVMEHKACNIEFISKISEDYSTAKEYLETVKKVEKLQHSVKEVLTRADKVSTRADATIEKAMTDFKQYRLEIETYLNTIDEYLSTKYSEAKQNNSYKYKTLKETLQHSEETLSTIHKQLTADVRNTSNLFVRVKSTRRDLVDHEQKIKDVKQTKLECITFKKNVTVLSEVASHITSETMEIYSISISAAPKNLFELSPRHDSDQTSVQLNRKWKCNFTSIVHIRDTILACTDLQNKSVLLLDIAKRKLLSSVAVELKPWCVTFIMPRTLAVTLTNGNMIQFYEVQDTSLRETNKITVNGECRGIDSLNDLLVVSFGQPPKVEIIDSHGNVLNVIQKDSLGNNIFKSPFYVAVSITKDSIYVSDNETHTVMQLTVDGAVVAVNKNLRKPRGLHVCNDGSVLVSSWNRVFVMSGDCRTKKVLIDWQKDILYAGGLCYNEDIGELYVRMYADDGVEVIQTYKM